MSDGPVADVIVTYRTVAVEFSADAGPLLAGGPVSLEVVISLREGEPADLIASSSRATGRSPEYAFTGTLPGGAALRDPYADAVEIGVQTSQSLPAARPCGPHPAQPVPDHRGRHCTRWATASRSDSLSMPHGRSASRHLPMMAVRRDGVSVADAAPRRRCGGRSLSIRGSRRHGGEAVRCPSRTARGRTVQRPQPIRGGCPHDADPSSRRLGGGPGAPGTRRPLTWQRGRCAPISLGTILHP